MAKQRIVYLLALAVVFLLFVVWDAYALHLLLYFLLLLPLLSLVLSLPLCFCLRCRLVVPASAAVRQATVPLTLLIRNRFVFPVPCMRATVACINHMAGQHPVSAQKLRFPVGFCGETAVSLQMVYEHCGHMTLRVKRLSVCDLFGLFSLPVFCGRFEPVEVYVLPERQPLEAKPETGVDLGQESVQYSEHKAGNDPSEIFRLRDYQPGDQPHAIHWKLSNRLERLIVREFGLPLNVSVRFLFAVDPGARLAQTDALLEAYYSLAAGLTERGVLHTVGWASGSGGLEARAVSDEDELAEAMHDLLDLPAAGGAAQTASRFAAEQAPCACHLIFLAATDALRACEPVLEGLLQTDICRRITVLTIGSTAAEVPLLHTGLDEVYDLSGGLLHAGLDEIRL